MFGVLLQTSRLVLRRFAPGDEPAFAAYRSDPEVARDQSWDAPYSSAEAERMVAEMSAADPRQLGWFQYAVERRDEPGLIGDVGVCRSDEGRQAELGFTFAPAHQGRGYAREAVTRIVEFLLVEEGLHRLTAGADGRNVRSARLLERVGFRREGYLIASTRIKGEWTDDLLFGLLASEWRRSGSHRREGG
jgi:RimJ/RimL family protein N-acetyltransferase